MVNHDKFYFDLDQKMAQRGQNAKQSEKQIEPIENQLIAINEMQAEFHFSHVI